MRFSEVWDDAGRGYFRTLVKEYTRLWRDVDFMNKLVRHWREYESKHHKRSYKRKKTSTNDDLVEKEVSKEDVLMVDEPNDYALFELPAHPPSTVHEEV